ncbi:hypothetical protein JXB02_02325 [Candidatus Woesearchaeota archaeon]|nr:hypothetical protein [Candidatus Woesearchaeota archaeon]
MPPPSEEALKEFLLHTLQHSFHVEYYRECLAIPQAEIWIPHDIAGPYNKFSPLIALGMALEYMPGGERRYRPLIQEAITKHRTQLHHRRWNRPNGTATEDDMRFGAVDTICSLLEDRNYNGGSRPFEGIIQVARDFPDAKKHQQFYIGTMLQVMYDVERPPIKEIARLCGFPNVGVPEQVYQKMIETTDRALAAFQRYGYEDLA